MVVTDRQQWQWRYAELLRMGGVALPDAEAAACPARLSAGDHGREAVTLAGLLEQPERLGAWLVRHRGVTDARELRAEASVLQQDLALTVLGPLTLRLLLRGHSVAVEPAHILLRGDAPDGAAWQWTGEGKPTGTRDYVRIMSQRLHAWYPLFRPGPGVGPGAYWSSIALAFSAPFSLLYDRVPPPLLCREATAWLARFGCPARRYVDWIPVQLGQQYCAIPQRRGCCLRFLTPAAEYCGTCGVYRKERMAGMIVDAYRNEKYNHCD